MKRAAIIFAFLLLAGFVYWWYSSKQYYFDYDTIAHYSSNISEADLNYWDGESKMNTLDSFNHGVLLNDIPQHLSDTSFIELLDTLGFTKRVIDQRKHAAINNVFRLRRLFSWTGTSCIYVYRDVLIFRKGGRIVGIAKICFGCMANQIKGSRYDTESFGQNGDYEKLRAILYDF